jgi:alpha-amylase
MKLSAMALACASIFLHLTVVAQKDGAGKKEQELLATAPVIVAANQEVLYEVNVRQFSDAGNFAGVIPRLSEIRRMGVTTLWLMPVYPIGVEQRKGKLGSYYSIKNYTDVNPEYGTTDDFKKLVDAAHRVGLNVIIDWVANHTSWDHNWVKQNPAYYEKGKDGKMKSPFDWTDVVELDYSNRELRAQMISAMRFWTSNFGIDGFRCDVADMVPLDFWKEARKSIDPTKQQLWLAESEDPNLFEVFDLQYAWKWMHMLEDISKGKASIDSMNKVAAYYFDLANKGQYHMFFTSNHDENSWNGTEYEKFGNQALPFGHLSAIMPGAFLIYNGQESAFNRRLKFFEKDPISWEKPRLSTWYKGLSDININYNVREQTGKFVRTKEPGSLAMLLQSAGAKTNDLQTGEGTIVLINGSPEEQEINIAEAKHIINFEKKEKPLRAGEVLVTSCVVKEKYEQKK